jgi:DNA-binding transcriptional regulator YiaG
MERYMKERAQGTLRRLRGQKRVPDGSRERRASSENVLAEFDATALVGLRTCVMNAAIERIDGNGERTVEVPKLRELAASTAVERCLLPIRIRGAELKAMRKIMRLTLAQLAKRLDEKTAPETVSRWETEAQPMGGYVEKLLRLLVCEELKKEAPGVSYNASKIAYLRVVDPWRADPEFEVPHLQFRYMPTRLEECLVVDTWSPRTAAA